MKECYTIVNMISTKSNHSKGVLQKIHSAYTEKLTIFFSDYQRSLWRIIAEVEERDRQAILKKLKEE